jgi:membrane protease YdiL (CAAX protease family)
LQNHIFEEIDLKKVKTILLAVLWCCIITFFPVASGVICVLSGISENAVQTLLVQGTFMYVSLLVPAAYMTVKKIRLQELFLTGIDCNGVRAGFYYIPCLLILAVKTVRGFASVSMEYVLAALFFCLGIGIAEEFYFRGIIIRLLNKQFKTGMVIFISALIFGLGHASTAFSGAGAFMTLMTILNALIFGWLAAEILFCTKSILPLAAFHFLFDFLGKIVPRAGNAGMASDILRGTLMFIYALYLEIRRVKTVRRDAVLQSMPAEGAKPVLRT